MAELDKLDPTPEFVILESGLKVQLESLRSRQFFKLLKIITHGAMPNMRELGIFDIDDMTGDEFMARLLTVVVMSIPDAEDETIAFVRSMCYPDGLVQRKGLNKQDVGRNQILWDGLDAELENPELGDLVTIIEAVVKRESADIQALGKRLASMFTLAQKTGQLSERQPQQESTPSSSADSRGRSTSSHRNTDGPTITSSGSALDDFDSRSHLSESDSTMPVGSASNG